MECTHHRIFIATLIIASKYIHDSALKNKYWVGYAQMFSPSEINLMEKQLLQLLVKAVVPITYFAYILIYTFSFSLGL